MGFFGNLFRDKSRDDEFVKLCSNGSLVQVKEALSSWGYVKAKDKNSATPVMTAAMNGDLEIIRLILEKLGRDSSFVNLSDSKKFTALHYAVTFNPKHEIINILLNAGASINAQEEHGMTPLMAALNLNQSEKAKILIEASKKSKADINAADSENWRALHYAALRSSFPEIITLLVEAGAKTELRNSANSTPLMMSLNNKNVEIHEVPHKSGSRFKR